MMNVTPGERMALRFLVGVALLGAAVQVTAAWRHRGADAAEGREALRRQLAAVDSAQGVEREAKAARRGGGGRSRGARDGASPATGRDAASRGASGVRSVRVQRMGGGPAPLPTQGPSVYYGPGAAPSMSMWPAEAGGPGGGDTDARRRSRRGRGESSGEASVGGVIDVDRASAAELEALPRVGPALAGRIVAARVARGGAFGSLEALGEVRGIGPTLLSVLARHVTFSGRPRPGGGR